jgi:hypothetical protein
MIWDQRQLSADECLELAEEVRLILDRQSRANSLESVKKLGLRPRYETGRPSPALAACRILLGRAPTTSYSKIKMSNLALVAQTAEFTPPKTKR